MTQQGQHSFDTVAYTQTNSPGASPNSERSLSDICDWLVSRLANGWLCSSCVPYLFVFISNDFGQTNYLHIYRADLRQICRVGRTVAVGERSEVGFSITHVEVATNFCWFYRLLSIELGSHAWHSVDGSVRQKVQVLR